MKTKLVKRVPQPLTLWRISIFNDLSGAGGKRASARWHTRGKPIVYLAESPAGAMLEVLAHLSLDEVQMPDRFRLLRVEAPREAKVEFLDVPSDKGWQSDISITQRIGDTWLSAGTTALAQVPSVIMPYTWNYLLNPLHPDAGRIKIVEASDHLYDPRLLRTRQSSD